MSLASIAITAQPGEHAILVDGQEVEAVRAVLEIGEGQIPTLTAWVTGAGTITAEGVVQIVRDPTAQEIDQAAVAALRRLDATDVAARVQQRLRITPRADPYQTTLDVIVELADG
ncbi:hypothetical protein [Cellulomonas sp.]|uniref:hypothetical protein n=1 Tax=Cellulomonas sp. TaxID=40001 RepID=UPI001B03E803|nr:hypothetical protein [Cellulomonas sp.]MBO9555606.1 hypothetical protein [Cellulomonas sp.]